MQCGRVNRENGFNMRETNGRILSLLLGAVFLPAPANCQAPGSPRPDDPAARPADAEITRVSNMTHEWSRALFEIPVAHKEDVDRVMHELVELGRELRRDPEYHSLILKAPEMLGVEEFADSAVVIKFFIKTRPLKQWTVKRELLRRIKQRFDELGIEIPFPHRTVYHRTADAEPVDNRRALAASGPRTGHP